MAKPTATKGNSGNTNGGTEISFTNTPQARDDAFGTPQGGTLDYLNTVYFLDVMANDLGGNAKALWSVDDGVNDTGAMSGYEAGDLLTEDAAGVTGIAGNKSLFGASLSVTPDGRVAYDVSTISGSAAADLTGLALGETLTDSFIYAIRLANGTLSWGRASVTLTGVNDAPTVADVSLAALEDGAAVSADFSGDDVDSDDDGDSLNYTIVGAPSAGTLTNDGRGFTFDPGADFQSLAAGETADINVSYTATDSHGAVSDPANLTITVTGVNDAPTLEAGSVAATEDGAAVSVDLSVLGADIDSDNDGSDLQYSLLNAAPGGAASIAGASLGFNPGSDFQSLAAGQTTSFDLQVRATDAHLATADNVVTVTVTGVNDAPVIDGGDTSGGVTASSGQGLFGVEQWVGYSGAFSLASLESFAASHAPNYTANTAVVDFTDDPGGFSGELPGSTPWPAALATGATGTGGINNSFFARITATVLITEADTYTFRTFNDDGVYLRVNNQLIINDPSQHPEAAFEGSITLAPGVYPLELYFFENGGEASLELSFKNSSGIYQLVTSAVVHDSGSIQFSDVDLTDTHTVSVAPVGDVLGSLTAVKTADSTGTGTGGGVAWEYSVGVLDYQSLGEGDTAVESFTVSVDDGNGGIAEQLVDITITGVNDVAVLGNAVVDLTETDAQQTTGGTLSITDVDTGEAFFNPQNNVAGVYGSFSIDANGAWSFTTDGALDALADGQVVTEVFGVTSVDGTATSVTVNITGTPDGPSAVDDSATVVASGASGPADNTVYWVDWQSYTLVSASPTRDDVYDVKGTITVPGKTIDVTYHGQLTGLQLTSGADYYVTKNSVGTVISTEGVGVFTSPEVLNGPTNNDIIRLFHADSPRTLTFSEPVDNLFFAIVSMNRNGYLFDQDFSIVSSSSSSDNSGYWGYTSSYSKTATGDGRFGITTGQTYPNEFHGVLAIQNAVESLTWVSQADEQWNGFTIGTYGVAQTATVSGNVIGNDDDGGYPIEVTDVSGTAMVGNSVTLNLASGAILKVDRDGDYLYDDNNAFTALPAGATATDTAVYTIEDSLGNSDTATLSITVTGINDAPVAAADAATVNEDGAVTINVLANDTDVDTSDTLSLQGVGTAQHGTVALSGNSVLYTPNADYSGSDSFSYTVVDAAGATSTATVNVTVTPVADTYVISNLIANGSFENSLTGWDYDQINYIGDWDAADGTKTLDLNAEHGGGYVQQSIQTVPGVQYVVGFALSKNPGAPTGEETLRVTAAGASQNYLFNQSNSTTNMLWEKHTFTFTASDTVTELRLASADATGGNDAWGPALDEVVAFSNRSISNFDKALGDKLDLNGLLSSINAPHDGTAFSNGFLKFQTSGADTLVQIDADGSGGSDFITVVTLVGVTLGSGDTGNYIL